MSRISRLSSSEPSFNIYELLYVKPNLLVNRALKNGAQTARRALSQSLFAKTWQASNMSLDLPLQRQSHIHELSNQLQVILKRLSAYNLSKLCYFIARCTRPFQASFSQHIQMVTAIQELFSQQKQAHSLLKKDRNSFIKIQNTNYSHPWGTNHSFHSKIKITCWDIIYVFLCTKYKLCLLTMTVQTQSGTNITR